MANSTTTNGGTIITVPAGKRWRGSISLSATLSAGAGGGGTSSYPSVTVSGDNGSWSNGDVVLRLALACAVVSLTSLVGVQTSSSICSGELILQARESPISLVLNFGSNVVATATAVGEVM